MNCLADPTRSCATGGKDGIVGAGHTFVLDDEVLAWDDVVGTPQPSQGLPDHDLGVNPLRPGPAVVIPEIRLQLVLGLGVIVGLLLGRWRALACGRAIRR